MHYIRFLKAPRVDPALSSKDRLCVTAKIAITTDLGEAFLSADLPLLAELEFSSSASSPADLAAKKHGRVLSCQREALWKGSVGVRATEIQIDLSNEEKAYYAGRKVRLCVRARDTATDAEDLILHLSSPTSGKKLEGQGKIVAVRSMDLDLDLKHRESASKSSGARISERLLIAEGRELRIWEELGESIARHIWYAFDFPVPVQVRHFFPPNLLTP